MVLEFLGMYFEGISSKLGYVLNSNFFLLKQTSGKIFLGTLSQAKIRVCKTCVSRDFSDLRQLAAICYKYIGYPCKSPQIAT